MIAMMIRIKRKAQTRGMMAVLCTSILASALVFTWVVATPQVARADSEPAKMVGSTPSPDQQLTAIPTSVTIAFDQHIKLAGSEIVVYDEHGQKASIGPTTVDKSDLRKLRVAMKGANNQIYIVVWHIVSADTNDPSAGSFSFGVNDKAGELSSATGQATSPSSPSAARQTIIGQALPLVIVALVMALLGGAGGFLLGRRRRTAV